MAMIRKKPSRKGNTIAHLHKAGTVPPMALSREREAQAWQWSCLGWPVSRIAEELGVAIPSVYHMLHRVEKKLLAEMVDLTEREKRRQTTALHHLLDEALQAWERSKQETAVGNLQCLQEARAALADLRKVWGVEIDRKEIKGGPQVLIQQNMANPWENASVEELQSALTLSRQVEAKSLPSPVNGQVIDHQPEAENHENQNGQDSTAATTE
jgi:hypothetical protein